jgi:hypothetical protein
LSGRLLYRGTLSATQRAELYVLFREQYERTTPESFARDLNGWQWLLVLRDSWRSLQGFLPLALYESQPGERRVSVLLSGDLVLRPDAWQAPELAREFLSNVLALSAGMVQPTYWLLAASGFRSYRFLPSFARDFWPRYDRATPHEAQTLLDHLARERFTAAYDPARGVARFGLGPLPRHAALVELESARRQDPHSAYFAQRNPGHADGDRLVCVTPILPDNFTPPARRLLH